MVVGVLLNRIIQRTAMVLTLIPTVKTTVLPPTVCLCNEHAGVQLPYVVLSLCGRLFRLLSVVLCLFVLVDLEVASADLVEQPRALERRAAQWYFLLPPTQQHDRVVSAPLPEAHTVVKVTYTAPYPGHGTVS